MLELVNVVKRFNISGNKEDERVALDHINLQIEPGEFVTIIGGNGSGKSTTLNIVSGTLNPDSGKVLLNGNDISKLPEYKRAAYFGRVFQDPMRGTAGDMTVLENLEIAFNRGRVHSPYTWGFSEKHKEIFIEELKRFDLGLENRLNQKVGVMSGGQRQALTLLMATIRNKPTIKMMRRDYIKFYNEKEGEIKSDFKSFYREKFKNPGKKKPFLREFKDKYGIAKSFLYPRKKKTIESMENDKRIIAYSNDIVKEYSRQTFDNFYISQKAVMKETIKNIKSSSLPRAEKREKIKEAKYHFESSLREKFDLTKQILLLDEHTAALDPKTAKKVLELTDKIVKENQLTTLMVTHNMKDALTYGNRLIMFHLGHIILDVKGEEKKNLTVDQLLHMFDVADQKAEQ